MEDLTVLALLNKLKDEVRTVESSPGPKGDTGDQGPIGPQGKKGDPGIDGAEGKHGKNGRDGKDGMDGKDGLSIIDVSLDFDNRLTVHMSDGTERDAGYIQVDDAVSKYGMKHVHSGGGIPDEIRQRLDALEARSAHRAISNYYEGTTTDVTPLDGVPLQLEGTFVERQRSPLLSQFGVFDTQLIGIVALEASEFPYEFFYDCNIEGRRDDEIQITARQWVEAQQQYIDLTVNTRFIHNYAGADDFADFHINGIALTVGVGDRLEFWVENLTNANRDVTLLAGSTLRIRGA